MLEDSLTIDTNENAQVTAIISHVVRLGREQGYEEWFHGIAAEVMDYRKLTTALPLLAKFPIQIDQTVTIQTGDQFVRLEYQGPMRGFQSFLTPTNALLGSSDVQANVMLKLVIEFSSPVEAGGQEIGAIAQALGRNRYYSIHRQT